MRRGRTVQPLASRELVALSLLTVLCGTAQAQQRPPSASDAASESLQEVVITGSRIARPDLDRLQPTVVIDTTTFDKRGYTDVGQALQELPAFGVSSSSAVNTQGGFGIAQSFVDLYSLGSQRTLTLVNGRRFVSSNTSSLNNGATSPGQQVDLNVIPTKLIDHVETISVGGAPIYGADAIAGTVNIILKKNYEGLDVDTQVGVSDDKDAWNYRLRALAGHSFMDGRLNFTGVAEYTKTDGLVGTSRKNFSSDLGFLAPLTPGGPYKTVLTPANSVPSVSTSGIPLLDDGFYAPAFGLAPGVIGVSNGAGQPLAFSPGSSTLTPYNLGTQSGNPIFWSGGDGIRLSQFSNLLSPTERINADVLGNFALSDHVNVYSEGWFSEIHSTNLIAQPAYNTNLFGPAGTVNGNFIIAANNPFLSASDQALIQSELTNYGATLPFGATLDPNWDGKHFYVSRANTDLQSGRATVTQIVTRGVLGVNGDFELLNRNFTWDVGGSYGVSRDTNRTPSYVFQNVQNALNAVLDASGHIVCAGNPVPSPYSTASSTCAPLNIFGLGAPSAAALAYITHDATAETYNTQRDITANLSGDVFKLPAGEWKAAVGFEHRRESSAFSPDTYLSQGFEQAVATGIEGAYRSNEVYAETLIPIFEADQDIPLLHQVELEGSARRVSNSISGSATTWTGGLRWSPTRDVQLRANKTKSIRAPAITELFLPAATANEFANDPCDKNYSNQGLDPATRQKNCLAAGINPNTFVSNVVNATAKGLTSGNTGLTPEIADSKTFGIVLRPRWLPKLSLSVDYIEINLTNAIVQLNLVEILDACYDSPAYPNAASCGEFTRNAQGQVTSFHDGFVNAGLLDFQGITVASDYVWEMPRSLGTLEARVNYLDTRKLLQQVGSAAPDNLLGSLGASGNKIATPHSKGTLSLDYRLGRFDMYWQALYTGGFNFDNLDKPNQKNIERVNPWWVHNATFSYEILKSLNVRFIVDNVFDKEPPYPALAAGTGGNFASATSLYFPGIIGRTYQLSVDYRF